MSQINKQWEPTVTVDEVISYVEKRNNPSAPGLDNVRYSHVEELFKHNESLCYSMMVNMVRAGIFLNKWKDAQIVLIPKEGKDNEITTGFRPISKISCLGKIFEFFIRQEI
jgi:hypothetical protein